MRKQALVLALLAVGCGSSPTKPTGSGTLQCSATPTSGFAPLTVEFSAKVVGGSAYALVIDFGDGTTGLNPNVAHVYSNAGVYAAGIQESIGGVGVDSCSQTITATTFVPPKPAETPPQVSFRVTPNPPVGPAPLTVKFNMCNSQDPDGDTLTYTFDFGDGTSAKGLCRQQHTYNVGPRNSNAVMCISDGHHQDCKDILVEAQ